MRILENKLELDSRDFLWKYLDFYRFLYLVLSNKIYFSRLDQFDDPFEGLNAKIILDKYVIDQTPSFENLNPAFSTEQRIQIIYSAKQNMQYIKEVASITQVSQFASCWYLAKRESRAMWDLFSDHSSVTIRFSATYLVDLIKQEAQNNQDKNYDHMLIGKINYQDLYPPKDPNDPDFSQEKTNLFSVTTKDTSYSHENEVRFVINRLKPDINIFGFELDFPMLSNLDFHIFTHPKMQVWKFKILYQLLERFDLQKKLVKSSISTDRII
jgi:hypothetical protein